MIKYINEETLRKLMYEEAFEKDSDMQKWDSGCWIRYKLFENCLEAVPAEDVVEVVRCRECYFRALYDADVPVCTGAMSYSYTPDDWFCAAGKRKKGGQDDAE